jgi:hypothetical protein
MASQTSSSLRPVKQQRNVLTSTSSQSQSQGIANCTRLHHIINEKRATPPPDQLPPLKSRCLLFKASTEGYNSTRGYDSTRGYTSPSLSSMILKHPTISLIYPAKSDRVLCAAECVRACYLNEGADTGAAAKVHLAGQGGGADVVPASTSRHNAIVQLLNCEAIKSDASALQ